MARVMLLANDVAGLEVTKVLREAGDDIVRLYLHRQDRRKMGDEICAASGCAPVDTYCEDDLLDSEHVKGLAGLCPEFIITVYWSSILRPNVIDAARVGTVNFHPALLPVNRGCYPHVHSILDGTPTGVTLHEIAEKADTGNIWVQKAVPLRPTDTAGDIYVRLRTEIVGLFRDNWPQIRERSVEPYPQDESKSNYHYQREIEGLDLLDLDSPTTGRDFLNRLRARTFGERGFAYFLDDDGKRVHVKVGLGRDSHFS